MPHKVILDDKAELCRWLSCNFVVSCCRLIWRSGRFAVEQIKTAFALPFFHFRESEVKKYRKSIQEKRNVA